MTESEEITECDLCSALLELFKGSRKQSINIRLFQSQEVLDCNSHGPLINSFKENFPSDGNSRRIELQKNMGFSGSRLHGKVSLVESVGVGGSSWDLLLIQEGESPEYFASASGDILDPNWVDLGKIKHWKTECLESHGSACENPMKIWATRPRWLVDVKMECIVSGDVEAEFVALSYTYGSHRGLDVNAELITKLREPYALREPEIAARLPPILRHAMFLTAAVDQRYLWVDALCIVHESSAETDSELSMMGSIYASAIMTIVSTDGDAEDGIVGLEGVSNSRELKQKIVPFGNRRILVRDFSEFAIPFGQRHPGPYYSRGWTYQEQMMAKRKIFFLRKQVHWECQVQQRHEDTALSAKLDAIIEPRVKEILAGFPVLRFLGDVLSHYNGRNLRYPEDALPGIIGLLTVLSRAFEGGFLCGIPEMFFDRAIAWGPTFAKTEIERRIESGRSKEVQLSPCHLPSWSWVGWKGSIELGQEASRIMIGANRLDETYQITEWYTAMSAAAEPAQRRRIHAKWYENREEWKRTGTLPPGWTHVEPESDKGTSQWPRLSPTGCEGSVYHHRNIPKTKSWGPSDNWFFPFPVQDISEKTADSMPEQTPYLFCRTQRARITGRKFDEGNNIIILYDRLSGNMIGTLHLHSKDQLPVFKDARNVRMELNRRERFDDRISSITDVELNEMFPPESITDSDLEIEVIAVSLTRVYSKTWNKETSGYGEPIYYFERYNVLWVEWKDGIAYRKAAGLIQKERWEQLELEDIDVVLG